MAAVFVHLSDIHFGQERDHAIHIHDDVKEQLIADAGEVVSGLPGGVAHGILVTGDIAHSGKRPQYEAAAKWLDRLAGKIRCPIHRVQVIPGNHDVDRSKLSIGGKHVLDYIRAGGPAEYEKVMADKADRASLFARFEDYGQFSFGYKCALDEEGKFATNLLVELAPGRSIRFIRMNSSLLCTGEEGDETPELMIGARQFTIPRNVGEENIVLVHHPLNWYKDAEDVLTYVRSRARALISGHEHDPEVRIDTVGDGCDLLMVAAGAAVPFKSDETYNYTYNVMEFDWDPDDDAMAVTMHPRAWNPQRTCFEHDGKCLRGKEPRFMLGCPNFRKAARPSSGLEVGRGHAGGTVTAGPVAPAVELVAASAGGQEGSVASDVEGYDLAHLRFFRDLLENEHLRILVSLDAIPPDSDERMTQGVERKLFEWLAREGRMAEVVRMMDKLIGERTEGPA